MKAMVFGNFQRLCARRPGPQGQIAAAFLLEFPHRHGKSTQVTLLDDECRSKSSDFERDLWTPFFLRADIRHDGIRGLIILYHHYQSAFPSDVDSLILSHM